MGRSVDQTFYADHYSKFGYGFGHELRYVRQSPSRGTFRTYVFDVKGAEELDYDLDWNALQILPGKVRASRQRAPVQRPPVPAALPGQLQPGLEPHPALVGQRSRRT